MSKKVVLGGVALVVMLGAAYAAGQVLLNRSAQMLLANVERSLPAGTTFSHGALTTNLLRREASLADVVMTRNGQRLAVSHVTLQGVPWVARDAVALGGVELDQLELTSPFTLRVAHARVDNPRIALGRPLDWAAALQSVSFTAAEFTDLALARTSPVFELKVATFAAENLKDGVLGQLNVSGVESKVALNEKHVQTTSFETLRAGELTLKAFLSSDGRLDLLNPIISYGIGQMDMNNLVIRDDAAERLRVNFAGLMGTGTADGIRTGLSVKVAGFAADVDSLEARSAAQYRALGYEHVSFDADLTSTYDPEKRRLAFSPLHIVGDKMGEISFSLQLENVMPLSAVVANPATVQLAAATLAFSQAEIKLRDNGYTARWIAKGAKEMQVEPAVFIEDKIRLLKPASGQTGPGAQRIGELYKSVSSFLLNPGELTIKAAPEKPIPLLSLLSGFSNPVDAAEGINLSSQNRQIAP